MERRRFPRGTRGGIEGSAAGACRLPSEPPVAGRETRRTPEFPSPEKYPDLDDRFGPTLDYAGQVAKSCIHCHQIGDAQRNYYRNRDGQFPEKLLFPYPHPKALGLILDPRTRATVARVVAGAYADQAGLKAGDEIQSMNGQPLLSIADVQWVLHNTPAEGGAVHLEVMRDKTPMQLTMQLKSGWRRLDDLSWRVSSWGLRRMTTGGLVLKPANEEQRSQLGIADGRMALRVDHVGQYNAHAAAKRAGFQKDDVLVSFAGRDDLVREADLFAHALNSTRVGQTVDVELIRGKRQMTLELPMQK